jgi:hypothetical protein
MRAMLGLMAVGMILTVAGTARAENIKSKVIDTNALVVKPVDTATSIIGKSFQYVSRVTASTLDNSQILRTVNNLFGTNKEGAPVQGGISPLPDPSRYPSTYYKSQIQPAYPKYQTLPAKR